MPEITPDALNKLVELVQSSPKYCHLDVKLIRRIGQVELGKRKNLKEAVKETRTRLHQVGTAFLAPTINYPAMLAQLTEKKADPVAYRLLCKSLMAAQSSTQERSPIVDTFFSETLASLAPVKSVLDLACGLNPLAIPWMPLAKDCQYFAYDIFSDMVDFIDQLISLSGYYGYAKVADITRQPPQETVQLAMLLKALPCLEQLDKASSLQLLDGLNAEHILVSYPIHSLGGRKKGMHAFYHQHFLDLVKPMNWHIDEFTFATELAFLIRKQPCKT